jgi:hypothetical protein
MGSYITLSDANSYISVHPTVGTVWNGLTNDQKFQYINYAEQQINNETYLGIKVNPDQEDEFPRYVLEAAKEHTIWDQLDSTFKNRLTEDDGKVPTRIKQGSCELIIHVLRTQDFDRLAALKELDTELIKAGSTRFEFELGNPYRIIPARVWHLIGYLTRRFWVSCTPPILGRI